MEFLKDTANVPVLFVVWDGMLLRDGAVAGRFLIDPAADTPKTQRLFVSGCNSDDCLLRAPRKRETLDTLPIVVTAGKPSLAQANFRWVVYCLRGLM